MPCISVALLSQIPEPLVMHLLVLGSGDEAGGSLLLVNRSVAANLGAPRLRLGSRPQRLRCSLGVIKAATAADDGIGIGRGPHLWMQHGAAGSLACRAHAPAPFRISAM
jgi:hypothetical protein